MQATTIRKYEIRQENPARFVLCCAGCDGYVCRIVNSLQQTPLFQPTDIVQERFAPPDGSKHKVLKVVDGDTVTIETLEGSLTVRVIGIDTPETVHPFKPVEVG